MTIELTDDGTMDTVLRCSDCGEEFRFSGMPDLDEEPEDPEAARDAYIEECIEEISAEHECSTDEDNGPQEEDITTTDHETFYQNGKPVLRHIAEENRRENGHAWERMGKGSWYPLKCEDSPEAALRAYMEKEQFWPNAWFISDHGNAHLIQL